MYTVFHCFPSSKATVLSVRNEMHLQALCCPQSPTHGNGPVAPAYRTRDTEWPSRRRLRPHPGLFASLLIHVEGKLRVHVTNLLPAGRRRLPQARGYPLLQRLRANTRAKTISKTYNYARPSTTTLCRWPCQYAAQPPVCLFLRRRQVPASRTRPLSHSSHLLV